jgi:hypothetical protein
MVLFAQRCVMGTRFIHQGSPGHGMTDRQSDATPQQKQLERSADQP